MSKDVKKKLHKTNNLILTEPAQEKLRKLRSVFAVGKICSGAIIIFAKLSADEQIAAIKEASGKGE